MTTPNEFAANLILANANLERLDSAVNDAPGTYTDKDDVAIPNLRQRLDTVETSATASATAALASETAAGVSETNAAASETAAGVSETNAAASETSALASANAALAALDSFDDRYLGAFAAGPTLDNDGDPLIVGALYFDTVNELMNVYSGTVWLDVGVTTEALQTQIDTKAEDSADTDLTVDPDAALRRDIGKAYVDGYTSANQTITSAVLLTLAHGLGARPGSVCIWLECTTAEFGYSISDTIQVDANASSSSITKFNAIYADATNVYIRFSDNASCFSTAHKTTGAGVVLTNSSWELIAEARR